MLLGRHSCYSVKNTLGMRMPRAFCWVKNNNFFFLPKVYTTSPLLLWDYIVLKVLTLIIKNLLMKILLLQTQKKQYRKEILLWGNNVTKVSLQTLNNILKFFYGHF